MLDSGKRSETGQLGPIIGSAQATPRFGSTGLRRLDGQSIWIRLVSSAHLLCSTGKRNRRPRPLRLAVHTLERLEDVACQRRGVVRSLPAVLQEDQDDDLRILIRREAGEPGVRVLAVAGSAVPVLPATEIGKPRNTKPAVPFGLTITPCSPSRIAGRFSGDTGSLPITSGCHTSSGGSLIDPVFCAITSGRYTVPPLAIAAYRSPFAAASPARSPGRSPC